MNSVRFLKVAVVLLVLINISVLLFMWLNRPQPDAGRHVPPGPNTFEYLVHVLNLTPQQVQQYTVLRDEHHQQFEQLRIKGHRLRDELYTHLGDTANNPQIDSLANAIAANQKQTDLLTFGHFRKLRAICTPEQQKVLDDVIGEALGMLGPPPPPPGREPQ